jgi:hypothetical protein
MLIERSRKLIDEVARLDRLRTQSKDIERFQTRQRQIEAALQSLRDLVRSVGLFRKHGLPLPFDPETIQPLLRQLATIRTAFEQDAASITGTTDETKTRFWKPIETMGVRLSAQLLTTWRNHVANATRANEQLLGVLERIPAFRNHVGLIRRLHAEAETLGGTLAQSDASFQRLDDLTSRLRQAWGGLPIGDLEDAALRDFLKTAGTPAGASLDALSPRILDWIRGHELVGAFRIVIGN